MTHTKMKNNVNVQVTDSFWKRYMDIVRHEVIPYQWEALNDRIPDAVPSRAIENFKIAAGDETGEFHGFVFQDSDVAKWIEAAAFSLENAPDAGLEQAIDEVIDLIGRAQQEDGYINTYFTIKEPEGRWSNLRDQHELYCAGHMIEAAVAYYYATGKRTFLDMMCRFADYIDEVFGKEEGKIRGYDGHQEIELALVKLYEATDNKKYLSLSSYFIDERGHQPHFFDLEKEKKQDDHPFFWNDSYGYHQAHVPVREQKKATGHAVRAMYMYTAMADLALKSNDDELKKVCEDLWENVTTKQMYVTAGVGSMEFGEAFSTDYDLPNDTAYTETCASIGLVFWAKRMLNLQADAKYADVMERALYNGTISGMDLDGKKFFYVNPLEVQPEVCEHRQDHHHVKPVRQKWFSCACCPPNLARLISSVGHYLYTVRQDELYVHLYAGNKADVQLNGQNVVIDQQTSYPWDEKVSITVTPEQEKSFTIALRIPGWSKNAQILLNGEKVEYSTLLKKGYVHLTRSWKQGDQIELVFPMPVEKIRANPKVKENAGKVALQRGPVVYCLEEADNGKQLSTIKISENSELNPAFKPDLLDGVVVIEGNGVRTSANDASWENVLYQPIKQESVDVSIKAIPYFAWCNREPGEMIVWIREEN
ncbi:glycoside hydrolase family 127 protein [Domibacillus sp. A3M-37]|uniref:glycoside hydrolase family 127 protein n=1 Tax=Domibacillus sp. A3M-37 TaxID=2962037 RepID=UPI0020B6F111|nr:beta-L-arabinofuranosidase domain-containing protein [Domibacillus sp. A3M-37]MCP3763615.1 glycoside hydrolase family 127 protein [Domibacillus sp. A3M-37]